MILFIKNIPRYTRDSEKEVNPKPNLNNSLGSAQKHDSMLNTEDNSDYGCQAVNEKSTENIREKSPSKFSEDVDKDTSTNDNNIMSDNKNKSEETGSLPAHVVTKMEPLVHNISQSFSQKAGQDTSKELGLKIENLLNNSMEKHENFSNKENLAANVIRDEPNIKNTHSNALVQSSKSSSIRNSNKLVKEKCISSCNLLSRSTELMDDTIVNVDRDVANDSMFEILNSDNKSKLVVETDSLSEPILNISSNKNISLKISSDLSSCESLELVQCMDDVMTTDDEKLMETRITLNKEPIEVHNEESNEIVNDSTISNIEKTISANEESGKDNIKSNTSMNDKDDIKEEVHKPDTLGNVQNDYGMSCTNIYSSPNLINTVPLTSPDKSSTANPECAPILKNKETSGLTSIVKTNTSAKSTNANQDSVTDVVKSSPPSTVTETPSKLAEKVSKKEESANKSSTLKNKPTEKSESHKRIDSAIEREYNLGGKDTSKFSDDDVRGDECRASETESSDLEDNGPDLQDFIVNDVEEDEESEDEGEKANEKIEIEELHTDENTQENQEREIKEQDEAMQVQEPDVIEDKIKEGTTEEESQNENEQENIENVDKLIDTSSKQKSRLEISDRLSRSQTNRKKKLEKVDTSQSEKSKKENSLSDLLLKQKVLSIADNILEVDRQKKRKKRKQSAEKNNTTILIEDSFLEDIDSQIVSKDKNVISTIDADKNKKVEEVFLNEKKKKQKITHININKDVEEVLHEEITDTKTEITKKPKKIKKKQEKEITENLPDICSENQVSGKKKKKISEALLNEEITTTRISKKTPKLSKNIVVQYIETAVEKLPKKKKRLVSKDASSQEKVLAKKLPKKQNLSSNDTTQDKNISTEKLSKKQIKLVEKDTRSGVKPVKKSNKLQQSADIVSDSNEGPTVVKFSEAQEEALKAVKSITDSIKDSKEREKKKQKGRMQEVELENEKPKFKKQKIKDNKTEGTKGIKRRSDEFLENLSDVPSKPLKKRKFLEIKEQILPSCSPFDLNTYEVDNIYVEKEFDTVSSCGSTTQFAVINIHKIKKKKKIPGIVSFKKKMIARNSRQPVLYI
ncbi:myb-like protein X isoform X2 [Osmia bicornis bicornis]|uniref:myb-like protein X isoform X2 n=1 Tax=Osmia bicornis bicornis TaxID=1437191 RepID=UPI001EAF292A|nr:myb-like protein X isoform X2 [Osmia bicornis bicornis]